MKKKLVILAAITLLALIVATPALAKRGRGGGGGQGQQRFALVGTITAIGSDTITVEVWNGNRLVKPYIGEELTVQMAGSTRFLRWTPDGSAPTTFDDVEVGDSTSITGAVSDSTFTARQVTVDVPLVHYLAVSASAGNGPPNGSPGWSHENPGQGGSANPGPGGR